jgi:hypothetical protein
MGLGLLKTTARSEAEEERELPLLIDPLAFYADALEPCR